VVARLIALVVVLGMWTRPSHGAALRVSPAEFAVQNVPVGRVCDLHAAQGIVLKIQNDDEQAHTYQLSTHMPAAGSWQEGYSPMPEPRWFRFAPRQVKIAAGAAGESEMFLSIPARPQYYNQHWVVSVAVEALPEAGSMVVLAAYPRVYIETEARADPKERPLGKTAVAPSVVPMGETGKSIARGELRIFNNDSRPHSYRLRLAAGAPKILPSPGRGWIANMTWLSVRPQRLLIGAGESRRVVVEARVPEAYGRIMPAWEALVFVEPERKGEAETNFVRIQAKTAGAPEP